VGVDPGQLTAYGPVAEDPTLLRKLRRGHGMILSRRLARERQYEVGDVVPVEKADGTIQDFEVVAISDAYGYTPKPDERMYGVVDESYLQQYFCIPVERSGQLVARLERGTDPASVLAALQALPESARIPPRAPRGEGRPAESRSWPEVVASLGFMTGEQVLDHHLSDIQRDFVLFDVLILLTAALAALGVLNGQLLAALERTKEIGVLKALGTTRQQVAGMVLIESLVVGLVGGAIGIGLGAVMVPVVVGALQDLAGLALPVRGAGGWLPAAFAMAAVLTLIAGLYPIWRMNRFDAVRAVRTG